MRHITGLAFLLLLAPQAARGQTFEELRAAYPGARVAAVTSAFAFLYREPDVSSDIIGRFAQGRELFAYNKLGDFYAVALPARGHVGYVLLTTLDVPQDPGAAAQPDVYGYKNPRTARLMSLAFPGAGHLYADETTSGALLIGISVASFIGGYALSEETRDLVCNDLFQCRETIDRTWLAVGGGVALAAWLFGIYDAPRAARRSNEAAGATASVVLAPAPLSGGAPRPALAVRLRW